MEEQIENSATTSTVAAGKRGGTPATIIKLVILIFLVVQGAKILLPGTALSGFKMEMDAAQARVESIVYQQTGIIPKTEAKVIYKNKEFVCVAVKYTIFDSMKEGHWGRVAKLYRGGSVVIKLTDDIAGSDVFNLSDKQMEQLKVLFEM